MSKKLEFDRASVDEAIEKYEGYWKTLPDDDRILAQKITMLTAYAGGRKRAALSMGVSETTLDNYRMGKTQPRFYELLRLARAAKHDYQYLAAGSELSDWARMTIHELRPSEDDEENYDDEGSPPIPVADSNTEAGFIPPFVGGHTSLDSRILRRLGEMVGRAHADAGVKLPKGAEFEIAADLYNEFLQLCANPAETPADVIDAMLGVIESRFKARLSSARAEPGTGKRLG